LDRDIQHPAVLNLLRHPIAHSATTAVQEY
jgi:hypothetical protein